MSSLAPYSLLRLSPLLMLIAISLLTACSTSVEEKLAEANSQWSKYTHPAADAYQKECRNELKEATEKFSALENGKPSGNAVVLTTINQLDILLDKSLSKSSLYRNVHPNAELRAAADECQQRYINLLTDISLSRPIFDQLVALNTDNMDSIDKRYVTDMITNYKRSGVNLDEPSRQQIRKLNEEILLLGQTYNKNIREDIRTVTIANPEKLRGMPQDYIDAHPVNENGQIDIATTYPDYFPLMQYAEDDELRKEMYIAFRNRAYPANNKVLKDLLTKRYELAKTLGYETYAEYVMEDLMIETPKNAIDFIDRIDNLAKPQSEREYQRLLKRLQKINASASKVEDWQKTYLEELVKTEQYQLDSQEVRQYFQYSNVKQGVFDLTETLFGVEIVPWETAVWEESVEAYEIREQGQVLGRFYLDMHPREGKYSHAAHFGIQEGVKDIQVPIAALVCNFPGKDDPSALLEHMQVETFLHEFGHLLHTIFGGQQRWLAFSGIQTERDFVEAPSQMLEEWVWDGDTLRSFAKNTKGEVIPDQLIKRMNESRKFGKGLFTRHQMFYAALSFHIYNKNPTEFDLTETVKQLQNAYSPFAYVPDTHFHASFGHLYGYSAVYYSYMWSLVIAADMFSEFEKQGLRNTDIAMRYRKFVLQPGGSKDAAELVENFLGREYSFESFVDYISNK